MVELETLMKEIAPPLDAVLFINSPKIVESETSLSKEIAPPSPDAVLFINSPKIVESETPLLEK